MRERLRGYTDALSEAGVPADDAQIRLGAHDADAAERVVRELLELPDPPTALFAGNNRITVGALRALGRAAARTAVVGFDDLELAELLAAPLSVVSYDAADLGRLAAELIVRRLTGDSGPPRHVVLPTTLVVRG